MYGAKIIKGVGIGVLRMVLWRVAVVTGKGVSLRGERKSVVKRKIKEERDGRSGSVVRDRAFCAGA
jgi:hypothetical protein